MIVNREFDLLWSNSAADLVLSGRQGLEIRGRGLCPTDPADNDALVNLLNGTKTGSSILCINRPRRDGWLLLRARCLDWPASNVFGITVAEATEQNRASYEHLDTAFGLTKAEHRVLLALLDGNEAEALAAMHGVSVETTRTHIRSIYMKVGVGSRERLFARLQHFRA